VGIFTPTEAGSVGALSVLILVIIKRDISLRGFIKSVMDSLTISCMVFILIAGATILGHFFAVTRMPFLVADWLGALPVHRSLIMIIIIFVYLIGGSFIEDLAFLILVTPIFLPLVLELGYDPVWFGVIVCVTSMIGIIIPPMAINVFIVSGIVKVPIWTVYKGIYPYIGGMSICLLILLFFPEISLWLPNLLIK
jgi:tripartite ATP-independent transporter DctM subunit